MLMFGGRNNWLHQEIANISKLLVEVASKLSALESDVSNINGSQLDHKGRIDRLDNRVQILERNESADDNKWSGAKTVWLVVGGVFTFLLTLAAVITVIVLLV